MTRLLKEISEDCLIRDIFGDLVQDLDDDCAALTCPTGEILLVSTDALSSGVHFLPTAAADLVAQKAVRSNVSDIVASGGVPRWLNWSLSLPGDMPEVWLREFVLGAKQAMLDTGVVLTGGDLTRSEQDIAISVTVIGSVLAEHRLHRRGAQAGDLLYVTGHLGEAGLGLEYILGQRNGQQATSWIRRHFVPPYRGQFAQALAASGLANGMMDLSDGLATDLPRLAKINRLGYQIELSKLPLSSAAARLGVTAQQAFVNGEDYELLIASRAKNHVALMRLAEAEGVPLSSIGFLTTEIQQCVLFNGVKGRVGTAWRHFA